MQNFYIVRQGDSVSRIAARWGIPITSLIAANNMMPPYTIYIGQQLSMPPGVDVYRVQPGDSVFSISQVYKISPQVIIAANQLPPPYVLQIGQLLRIPVGVPYYIVQPGDTLYQIARRYNVVTGGVVNYSLIMQVNQLSTSMIYPGMRLTIPYAPPGELGQIAYFSNQGGGGFDLWLYNPSNGATRQITFGQGESYSVPYWSPDSKNIAFVGRNGIINIIDIVNTTQSQIDQVPQEDIGYVMDFSPDSQSLVYMKQNEIFIYNIATHDIQRITQPGATDPQWFPNGEEILFQAPGENGFSQLFRIRRDGDGKGQITRNTGGLLNTVRLSPDGKYVTYTTPGASISIIHIVEIASGRDIEVQGGPLAKNYQPEWSPDSNMLSFSATILDNLGYFSQIRTVDKQGENERIWAISNCFSTPVTWSIDSRKIAYLSGCSEQMSASEMWLIDTRHPVPIRLLKNGHIVSLRWSPTDPISEKNTYTNLIYQVQFQFPSHWQRVDDLRYEGDDGFFQISAIVSNESLENVCRNEAFHQLQPYGTSPRIVSSQIQGQPACYIYPSSDQPQEMREQAALIVSYPRPVIINGNSYNFFILWADQDHINEIGISLSFL